jgi:GNAT superfamily N-acetyltransferase
MNITDMTVADLPAITVLSGQLGYPETLESLCGRYDLIARDPVHKLWVARAGDKIAGWMHAHRSAESMINPPFFEIAVLVVDEAARGTGAGKALLKHAEDFARATGYAEVRLHSNMKREHAHEFYARQGYERRKIWGVFFKTL